MIFPQVLHFFLSSKEVTLSLLAHASQSFLMSVIYPFLSSLLLRDMLPPVTCSHHLYFPFLSHASFSPAISHLVLPLPPTTAFPLCCLGLALSHFSSFLSPFNQDIAHKTRLILPPLVPSLTSTASILPLSGLFAPMPITLCSSPPLGQGLDPPFSLLPARSHTPHNTHVQILNLTHSPSHTAFPSLLSLNFLNKSPPSQDTITPLVLSCYASLLPILLD